MVRNAVALGILPPERGADVGAPLMRDVARYVAFGEHRSGTIPEAQTAGWIARRLSALGFKATIETTPVSTLLRPSGELVCADLKVEAFPQWRPPTTVLGTTLEGPLAPLGALKSGAFWVMGAPAPLSAYWPAGSQATAVSAGQAGAKALLMAFAEPTDGIFACNQEVQGGLPLPVALLRPSDLLALQGRTAQGAAAHLTLLAMPAEVSAHSVLARKPGSGAPIVISTPLSGWFRCGAERGPGVALMLHLAARLSTSVRPVWILATGAHELGHLGMKQLLETPGLPPPAAVGLWLHLGAGLASRGLDAQYHTVSPQFATVSRAFEIPLKAIFPAADWIWLPVRPGAPGEGGDIAKAGYEKLVSLAGVFPGFHTQGDDGSAIDPAALVRLAETLTGMVADLA